MTKRYLSILLALLLVGNCWVPGVGARGYVEWSMNDAPAKVTRFYPNPATTVINFEFDKTVDRSYSLHICNFLGKKMTQQRVNSNKLTVNLDDEYYRGLYVYQLRDAGNRIVESGKFQVVK
jgi:hypothetical protein